MSETDSFIDEVTEEVRRDRLFAMMRKWAWLAVLIVLVLVGGTAWNEYRKNVERAQSEAYGDSLLAAMEAAEPDAQVSALEKISNREGTSGAVQAFLTAAAQSETAPADAAATLIAISEQNDVDQIYRQIAMLKAASMADSGLSTDMRRDLLAKLELAPGLIRVLAQEQLALIDVGADATGAALERFRDIALSAEATPALRARAQQMIIALGGDLSENAQSATDSSVDDEPQAESQ